MVDRIVVKKVLNRSEESILLDVRTPAEYNKGHIPSAYNLPLFSNEERAEVGTLYKQVSPEQAMLKGLEIVGPKLKDLVEQATVLAPNKKVTIYCWRGGNRSSSLGWLLDLAGFDVQVLVGGYKAFRTFIHEQFDELNISFIILGGETGSGKTVLLHALSDKGEQMIDLEALANHKGSTFGALGQLAQPSVEHFENLLYIELSHLDINKKVWIENESRAIGRVYIPEGIWLKLLHSPIIGLQIPIEKRIKRLVEEYADFPTEDLKNAFMRIQKRIGGQHLKAALEALDKGDYETAVAIGLRYYDKAYHHHASNKRDDDTGIVYPFTPKANTLSLMVDELLTFARNITYD